MQLYFFYLFKHYTKNFIIFLLAISLAVTAISCLQNLHTLPEASGHVVLYLFYTWQSALTLFYPLAIILATVITYMGLSSTNAWTTFHALGYSHRALFRPFVLSATLIYLIFFLLQLGSFAHAKEKAQSLLHKHSAERIVDDLFFKYNDAFVHVKRLDPIEKSISDVTMFYFKNQKTRGTVAFPEATYDGSFWIAKDVTVTQKKYGADGTLSGFSRRHLESLKILEGYRPKVIELIYEGESLSIIDAFNTFLLLKQQGLDATKVVAALYAKVVLPLFALALMTIIFFKTPYHQRSIKKEWIWSLSLGGTLIIWGILHSLYRLSSSSTISPEFALLLPVGALHAYAVWLYLSSKKNSLSIKKSI